MRSRYVILYAITAIFFQCCKAQEKLLPGTEPTRQQIQIIDISQKQLALYKLLLGADSLNQQAKTLRDSLYYPYQDLWDGYVGGRKGFDLTSYHYGLKMIDSLSQKNRAFYNPNHQLDLTEEFIKSSWFTV